MKSKIMKLDKSIVEHIRERLKQAVHPLAEELGIMIKVGSCAFRTHNCKIQLNAAVYDSNGRPMTERWRFL